MLVFLFLLIPSITKAQGKSASGGSEISAASKLIDAGELQQAELRLKKYLATHPHSGQANQLLGFLYLRLGHLAQAEAALRIALAATPQSADAYLALGDVLVLKGDLDQAESVFRRTARIAPEDIRADVALARLNSKQGRFAESLAAAEKIPSNKRTPDLLPILAADYFGLHQAEKAWIEVTSMVSLAEKYPDLVPELVEFFLASGNFQGADQVLTSARDKQPPTERFQIDIARVQAGLGRLASAQETLEAVLEKNPSSVDALVAAAQVARQQGEGLASEEALSRAFALSPDRPDVLSALASLKLYGNQPQQALPYSERLRELTPNNLRATYLLALSEFGSQKYEQAKIHAEEVLRSHPGDREMNLVSADVALNIEHDLATARNRANTVLKAYPNDAGALYYEGMIKKMDGDVGGAVKSLAASVMANPKNPNALSALGSLYLQTGDTTNAIPCLEQAVALSPDEAQNHYQLALAYSRVGAAEKARDQLQSYQRLKEKEVREAKGARGPATSEVAPVGIPGRP